ncbi:DUF418 domain-containing protein [Streptomyces sp. LBUM 1486]|nr:DUF418 domain-containing protein [Streptomyces sp. LBUM 1485]MBP5911489.1 DUF418 domain-containing protein [Streptomyces sp. LBUM 1486]QTU52073.1 DUF418 domain-containing protein [Streptomyces sp. LBUM 1480]
MRGNPRAAGGPARPPRRNVPLDGSQRGPRPAPGRRVDRGRARDLIRRPPARPLLAALWIRRFRRGPLEHLLDLATRPARHIR